MPAAQKVSYQGFEITAKAGWWLRKWTRFPLFFQATHPTFELIIKKVIELQSEPREQPESLSIYVEFSDQTILEFPVDVSPLEPGQTLKYKTPKILLAPTGDARVCLDMGRHLTKGQRFETLFAFVVSSEATLVFLLLNVLLGALLALLLRL